MNRKYPPFAFVLPFMVLFALFFIGPRLYALYVSLFVQHFGVNHFVGLQNYRVALTDPTFWQAVARVAYYGVVQVSIMLTLALLLALLLDSPFATRYQIIFRLLFFLPYAVPGVIAAIMWGFLYAPSLDPLLHAIGPGINPLASGSVLYAIVNIALWEWTGYNMTIYFASLTSIPIEIYDAAKIDGCGEMQLAWHIKIPLLRSTMVMTTVLSIIGSLQLFNEPYILSTLTSMPSNFTPNMDVYNFAFSYDNIPYAAALSIVLAALTIVASLAFLAVVRERTPRDVEGNLHTRRRRWSSPTKSREVVG